MGGKDKRSPLFSCYITLLEGVFDRGYVKMPSGSVL